MTKPKLMLAVFSRTIRVRSTFGLAVILLTMAALKLASAQTVPQAASPLRFEIRTLDARTGQSKKKFFLGEAIPAEVVVTNQSRNALTITELIQTGIPLTLSGKINHETEPVTQQAIFGGTFRSVENGAGSIDWVSDRERKITLAAGKSTSVKFDDLSSLFETFLDDGHYTLRAEYNGKLRAECSFNVAIDVKRSTSALEKLLASGNESQKAIATYRLSYIRNPAISGQIRDQANQPLPEVDIKVTGTASTAIETDSVGRYHLVQLSKRGTYVLTPKLEGYTFNPASRTLSKITGKISNVDFTALPEVAGTNVAAEEDGNTVVASSEKDDDYPAESVIDGISSSNIWGQGNGGWSDGTPGSYPDWIEVDFKGPKVIDWINVFTLPDDFRTAPEPTTSLTFSKYGIENFDVQYWDGSRWKIVPRGHVKGNNKVLRRISFPAISTSKIRVVIYQAKGPYSCITEIEAFHQNRLPVPKPGGPNVAVTGVPVTFSGSQSTDPDGRIVEFEWYFGDDYYSKDVNPTHTYASSGTYKVRLIVTDDFGKATEATTSIKVENPPARPNANPGGPYHGAVNDAVFFEGRGSYAQVGIQSYTWDFGDNTRDTGATAWHAYSASGEYHVSLTVTDKRGDKSTNSTIVTISQPQPEP